MNNQDGLIGMIYKAWMWLIAHPLGFWTGVSAFLVALWSTLKDGAGWVESIAVSIISVVVALGLVAVMRSSGMNEDWMPIIGMMVSFIGVDRIRFAIRSAWDSRSKHILLNGNKSEKNTGETHDENN